MLNECHMPQPRAVCIQSCRFFFFNDPATTEIYTLSLHDALPISTFCTALRGTLGADSPGAPATITSRSEEHTSELQSRQYLVCRLLLEKKKKKPNTKYHRNKTKQQTH